MNSNIYQRIEIYCEKHKLFQKGDGVIVGLSGGADSVFLLYALTILRETWNLRLHAVHINHGIRGREALRDQEYSVALAKRLGVPCEVYQADIPGMVKREHLSEEEAGRRYRYHCFEQCRKEKACTSIAVAHHQEDQAETVLFQMLRGSSLRGLGGMRPKRGNIVRPLLEVSRQEIERELARVQIPYCQDSTNQQDIYARNILRHHVIPYLQEKIQPAATAHIAECAAHLQGVMDYMEEQAEKAYCQIVRKTEEGLAFSGNAFTALHPALQRELAVKIIEELAGKRKDITKAHIQAVCRLAQGGTGKKLSLPYAVQAEKSYDMVLFFRKDGQQDFGFQGLEKAIPVVCGQPYRLMGVQGRPVTVIFEKKERKNLLENELKNYCTKCFDYDRMVTMPILRRPAQGDYLWLDSSGKRKKLSRLFIDEKIPANQRRETIVLAEGSHILWVPLLDRCSAYYYVTGKTQEIMCASPVPQDI